MISGHWHSSLAMCTVYSGQCLGTPGGLPAALPFPPVALRGCPVPQPGSPPTAGKGAAARRLLSFLFLPLHPHRTPFTPRHCGQQDRRRSRRGARATGHVPLPPLPSSARKVQNPRPCCRRLQQTLNSRSVSVCNELEQYMFRIVNCRHG